MQSFGLLIICNQWWNDIGLIKLKNEIDLRTETVNGVCLPEESYEIERSEDQYAKICGWGDINKNVANRKRLKTISIRLNPNPISKPFIESNGNSSGIVCPGDSGSPLIRFSNGRAVLIGVWHTIQRKPMAEHCGDIGLLVFTSIPETVDWIVRTIRENS